MSPASWNQTGSMPGPHGNWAGAAVLARSRVLVAGGLGVGDVPVETAAIYSARQGKWKPTGSMGAPRWQHTTTLLPDGRVLVAGGLDANDDTPGFLSTAEIYDPVSGVWTATDSMAGERAQHTATLLPNGKVLVAGGFDANSPVVTAELYDPQTASWTQTGSMAHARFSHTATRMIQGSVLVAGGRTDAPLASAELYRWNTGLWQTTGSLTTARGEHTALQLKGGRVLVMGGTGAAFPVPQGFPALSSAEVYSLKAGTWTPIGDMTSARFAHSATRLKDGRILVAGGEDKDLSVVQSAEIYDDNSGDWTATVSMNSPRAAHVAAPLKNGAVLVAGGFLINNPLEEAELYTA